MKNRKNIIIVLFNSALIFSVILLGYISLFVQPEISATVKIDVASHGGYAIIMDNV